MPLPVFDPCAFNFETHDLTRTETTISGGRSLSGNEDEIATDGGGYWALQLAGGTTFEIDDAMAWRLFQEQASGAAAVEVVLDVENLFRPRNPDGSGSPAAYTASASAALRATTMTISGTSDVPVVAGMLFSIAHTNWGKRVYRVMSKSGGTITFVPPLREAITSGTALDFNTPTCTMKRVGEASSPTTGGRYTECAIAFVEYPDRLT